MAAQRALPRVATSPDRVVDVAACLVRSPDGRVLLAERTARQLSPGFWEAPGGKIDPGETPAEAAARELWEEVGLEARDLRPWLRYEHAFPTRRIRLSLFLVDAWGGSPAGREGQRLAWVDPGAPAVAPILPSNDRALRSVSLPGIYHTVTVNRLDGADAALTRLAGLLKTGARLVRFHADALAADQRVALARRAGDLARRHGARILIAGLALEALRAGAAGIHTSARDLTSATSRPPADLWAVACRGAAELSTAAALGADLAVLEPEGPGATDWDRLGTLSRAASMPVYWQAPATPAAVARARAAGAVGVADVDAEAPA